MPTNPSPMHELLYQALETEQGGINVYEAALECALNDDLRKEWTEYLQQTREHERTVREVLQALGLDPSTETPGRAVVRHIGESLVAAMTLARQGGGPPEAAELVAAECVVFAETKDHMNWELIGQVIKNGKGDAIDALRTAYEQVEDEEDEHLYHSSGWTRELWINALGMPAVLPPPEEIRHVETKIGAARAEKARDQMM